MQLIYTQLFTVLEDILKRLDSLEQWRIESITGADLELEQCCAQISQCHLIPSADREKIATYLHETRMAHRPAPLNNQTRTPVDPRTNYPTSRESD